MKVMFFVMEQRAIKPHTHKLLSSQHEQKQDTGLAAAAVKRYHGGGVIFRL
jgi:hypothetical protein